MIFDTHAHYNDEAFRNDLDAVVGQFHEAGIGRVVNVADSVASVDRVLELADRYPFFYAALGIHPACVGALTEEKLSGIRAKLHAPKVVAVGEIGLDYHYGTEDKDLQQHWFRRQLSMAREERLPVIIHSRDAAKDTMDLIREEKGITGVIHCYSYSPEMAEEYVRMGFFIGVGGVVTFRNGRKLKETVRRIPIGHIVLETDCPYLAPEPHRGERNSSLYLPYVVKAIAALKEMTPEEVIRATEQNAERLYGLTEKPF